MLDFQSCIWRCLRAIRHERPTGRSLNLKSRYTHQQHVATVSTWRSVAPARGYDDAIGVGHSKRAETESRARNKPTVLEVTKPRSSFWEDVKGPVQDNDADAPVGVAAGVRGHIQRELVWLKDPVKLAERTRALLAEGHKDSVQKAFELVRMASKDVQCTLCWNALIHHLLEEGRGNAAFQTFNDVRHAQSQLCWTDTDP